MDNKDKVILDLCGGTGAWSAPYREAGYTVIVVDIDYGTLSRVEDFPENFIDVYGILAAPPCTAFAVSGARWFKEKDADGRTREGVQTVAACLQIIYKLEPVWWCLENPVGRLVHYLGPPEMYFQPYEFGDPYTKKTCLWGDFNEPVQTPVEPVEGGKIWRMPPSPDRAKLRSITPPGFAKAFFDANP